MIPFEKTSRSPRFANWRGKKRSRASSAARRGKPWNEVFAARTRIANVVTWTTQNMKPNVEPLGNVARAIWETTETLVLGRAPVCTASHETPTKNVTAITPRIASVRAALRACGCRNALTPFEIASMPVRAPSRRRTRAAGRRT